MSDKPPTDLLGALPRTRPHRRSGKRAERPGDAPETQATTAAPPATPARSRSGGSRTAKSTNGAQAKKPVKAAKTPAAGKPAPQAKAGKPAPQAKATSQAKPAPQGKPAEPARVGPKADAPATRPPRPKAVSGTGTTAPLRGRSAGSRLRQPPQPAGTPSGRRSRKPVPASGSEIVGTAVQAAAELAEIGLSVSARALRNAVSKLPKP